MILPLKSVVSAADLLSEVDSVEYYSRSSDVPVPFAMTTITDLFGVKLQRDGNKRYINGMDASQMTFFDFVPTLGEMLTNIDDAMLTSADLTPIQTLLNTYLPRIDMNGSNLHGDLLNIQNMLGLSATGSGDTLYSMLTAGNASLSSIDIRLNSVQTQLGNVYARLGSILNFMNAGFSDVTTRQDNFSSWWSSMPVSFNGFGKFSQKVYSSVGFPEFLSNFSDSMYFNLTRSEESSYLDVDGFLKYTSFTTRLSLSNLVARGFLGLSFNLSGRDNLASFSFLVPSASGGLERSVETADNLLDALALLGGALQNPLAKLQYVWADDDDIRIADANKPVKGEIEENFVGDGDAAVKVGDISDVAGLSTGVADAFSGAGSPSDVFILFGDSDTSWFFSQEVASDLDQVNSPVPASEADVFERYLSDVDVDDDGYVHPKASSFWDVSLYLG